MFNYFPDASLSITRSLCLFAFACSVISKTACALPTPARMGFSLIVQGVEQQAIWRLCWQIWHTWALRSTQISPVSFKSLCRILHFCRNGSSIVWVYYLKRLFSHCLCTVILEVSVVIMSSLLERNHLALTDHSLWTCWQGNGPWLKHETCDLSKENLFSRVYNLLLSWGSVLRVWTQCYLSSPTDFSTRHDGNVGWKKD